MGKKWFTSKTIWVNALALAGVIVTSKTGYVIPEDVTVAALTGINVILRFITHEAVSW